MNIIISKYAHPEVYQSIRDFNPSVATVPGSFWIMTDDGTTIAVICATEKELINAFGLIQSTIAEIQSITEYVYVIIESIDASRENQILSLQELGAFVVTTYDVYNYLPTFIKFISNPKRRQEKVVQPPKRDLRMFTVGEQLLLTIPGVGERKAKDLLQHFGPVVWVLAGMTWSDTPEYLSSISAKDIKAFRDSIGIEDNMILSVIMKEDK